MMPEIGRMNAVADRVFVDAMQASAANPLAVPRPLFRLLAAAQITAPADVDKLDAAQLGRLLQDKTPGERIAIKQQVMAAGLYPRDTNPFGFPIK